MWLKTFIDCTSCNDEKSLGWILHESRSNGIWIIQVCKNCKYSKQQQLPTLNKKVIYLDQFFISNVLKVLKPEYLKSNNPSPDNLFYKQAWEKLRKLYLMQLIVCPYSWFHNTESMAFKDPTALQSIFEELAGNVFFYDPFSIYEEEIIKEFLYAIAREKKLVVDDILYGDRNS